MNWNFTINGLSTAAKIIGSGTFLTFLITQAKKGSFVRSGFRTLWVGFSETKQK